MSNARKLADNLPREGQLSGRNLIINGNCQVNQRGNSTGTTTQGYSGPDRFNLGINGRDQFAVSISQAADGPDGFTSSFKLQTTTPETSITDTEYVIIRQIIEAQNLQHLNYGTSSAKQLTASFWVKSSIAATFGVFMYQYDGGRTIGSTYTINSANTWEYKTVTFAGDIGGTINNDNGQGQYLAFTIAAGSDLTTTDNTSWGAYTAGKLGYGHSTGANAVMTTTNATWQVTGVQLEVGSQATPFEHESYDTTLEKCQRYFQKAGDNRTYGVVFNQHTGVNAYSCMRWWKPMRAAPVIHSMSTSNYNIYNAGYSRSFSQIGISQLSENSGEFYLTTTSLAAGSATHCNTNGDLTMWKADAEL